MNIRFDCPVCETPARVEWSGPAEWRCPACEHLLHLPEPDPALPACAVCGNHELYKKKDFPHELGMGILLAACAASTVTYWLYAKALTWAILLGSAAFDGLLYLVVRDVIVCYRCNAHYRAVPAGPSHQPFELNVHERYRQEKMRRQQLEKP